MVFRPISGLFVVLPKVSCFKHPLNKSTTLSNHCLVAYLSHGSDKNNMIIRDSTTQKILDRSFFFLMGFYSNCTEFSHLCEYKWKLKSCQGVPAWRS